MNLTAFAWQIGLIVLLLVPTRVFPNGFDIYEQSGKAVGLGGAFTATADDPSAIFFNPAGITQLAGTQVALGACSIKPSMRFETDGNPVMGTTPGQTWRIRDHTWTIPHAYITHKVNDRVSFGVGSFANFGLGVEWPKDFEGRFSPGATRAILVTNSVSPVVAVNVHPRLSFGIGPYVQYFSIELRNRAFVAPPVPPLTPDRNLAQMVDGRIKMDDWDYGLNVGALFKVTERLHFGAAYMSQVRHRIRDGRQQLFSLADGTLLIHQGASATITLPAKLRLGLAWKSEPWTLEAGAEWTEWSSYRTLRADFENGTFLESDKRWRNVWMVRFGAQYRVNKYLDLRAAILYDESPIPGNTIDPLVPSGDRVAYCLGAGVHVGPLTVDVGYNYVQDKNRRWASPSGDVTLGSFALTRVTGEFKDAYAHVLAVTASYRF
jgi:long-chain fatty acid transport protein